MRASWQRRDTRWAKRVYGAAFRQKADITLSSTYPIDFDLFQADKRLFSAAVCTNEGGEIILASPCYEGISPAHPEAVELGSIDDEELWQLARSNCGQDPLSIAEVLYFNSLKRLFKVTLATEGVSPQAAARLGFNHLEPAALPEYLSRRLGAQPGLTVGIVRCSAETLPVYWP